MSKYNARRFLELLNILYLKVEDNIRQLNEPPIQDSSVLYLQS